MSNNEINGLANELEREYGAVYDYMPPTNMPGVRQLAGVPEDVHIVHGLNKPSYSFVPPNDWPIIAKRAIADIVEGFCCPRCGCGNCMCNNGIVGLLYRLLIFCFVVAVVYHIILK
jgi:hypothetical protein